MTPKSKTQNSSISRGHGKSITMGHAESRSEGDAWSCGGCTQPTCRVCSPGFSPEHARVIGTLLVADFIDQACQRPDPERAPVALYLDAALRLMRNAALIFRDTAYDLEELVHTIEAARTESRR